MNKNEKFVITINREVGSGGRTIGEKLAKKLGVTEKNKVPARSYNLDVDEIEKMRDREYGWWAEFKRVAGIGHGLLTSSHFIAETGKEPDELTTESVFKAETEILRDIAAVESCVIAGRSGFFVFRDHPNHLRILIQASLPYRTERLMRKRNITEDEARAIIEKVDRMRNKYVERYTGTSRYDFRNYDIAFTVDGKTEDEIVDQILMFIG